MKLRYRGFVGCLLLVSSCCSCSLLSAGTITPPFEDTYAFVCLNNASACSGLSFYDDSRNPPNPSFLNVNQSFTGTDFTLGINGYSQAGYGVLHAAAAANFTTTGNHPGGLSVSSGFLDDMTISYGPLNGQTGYLAVSYTIDGTMTRSGAASPELSVRSCSGVDQFDVSPVAGQCQTTIFTSSVSGKFGFPGYLTFTYGQPFDFSFRIISSVNVSTSGVGSVDFGNTLVLSGLQVLGPDLQAVSNPTFSSASGTQYSTDGVVPEPSSVAMILSSLCVLPFSRMRPKRS